MKKHPLLLLLLLCSSLSLLAQPLGKFGGGPDDGYGLATISGSFVLPLEWTAISVQQTGPDALLHWSTADEVNTQRFEVQRARDGQGFETLSQLPAQGYGSHSYSFRDVGLAFLLRGTVYYRIRQIDQDGQSSYSPVVALSLWQLPQLVVNLFPNPVSDLLHLSVPTGATPQVSLRCFGLNGQLLYEAQMPTGGETEITVQDWEAGLYLWEISDGIHWVRKAILIQH